VPHKCCMFAAHEALTFQCGLRGLTLPFVASLAGIDRKTLYRWRKGIKSPSQESINRVLRVLQRIDTGRVRIETPTKGGAGPVDQMFWRTIEALRKRRQALGMTQADVDDKAGLTAAQCARWESGDRRPMFWQLCLWAATLGVEIEIKSTMNLEKPHATHREQGRGAGSVRHQVPVVSRPGALDRAVDQRLSG
jgi:transcriptional regulator with XRE-family HTH domain